MLEINLRSTRFINVALRLKHRHNNLKNLKSLIEFLENYFKLSMYLVYLDIFVSNITYIIVFFFALNLRAKLLFFVILILSLIIIY